MEATSIIAIVCVCICRVLYGLPPVDLSRLCDHCTEQLADMEGRDGLTIQLREVLGLLLQLRRHRAH